MEAQPGGPPLPIARREPANNRPGNRLATWTGVEGSKLALAIARREARTTWGLAERVAGEIAWATEVFLRGPVQALEAADLEAAQAE